MSAQLKSFLSLFLLVVMLMVSGVASVSAHPKTDSASFDRQDPTFPEHRRNQVYIESHRVDVEITNQIAKTRIKQVFVNQSDFMAEGTYVFPLPKGVTISDLVMYIDGTPIQSRILEKDEARRIYDEIVRSLRDPALLEYVGTNAIQANVFPIPAGDERTLEIEFNQLLTIESGLLHYVYPIRTDHITGLPVKELSVRVSVESDVEISNIYSPTHRIDIDRKSDTSFVAGFETRDTLETTDFSLYYGVATEDINLNLLTYRESANEDGFFLALISPPFDIEEEKVLPKDVIVVLDNSGSMYGVKWEQAVEAAKFVLDNLNDEDRFNIVSFSTSVRIYANELQGVDEVDDAKDWLSTIEAIGGTNINEALQTALEMNEGERQTVLLFLTDGLATEGETETAEILKNVEAKARGNMSLFAFGVGNDVDTFLLDQLSAAYRGASAYVRPEESITEEVGNLYNKIRAPLFTHILLDIDGVDIYDVFPDSHNLPDLFVGSQLVIVGRYRGDTDNATLVLSGQVGDDDVNFSYENLRFRTNAGGEVLIPRLWATRKIGDLLNAIRLHGENPELVDSIVRLSIRYGIITPYTSFLITEDDIFSQTGRDRAMTEAEEATFGLDDTVSGEAAVNAAEASRDLSQAEIPSPAPTIGLSSKSNVGQSGAGGGSADGDEVAQAPGDFGGVVNPVQYVSDRTFVYRDGKWIDTLYDADTMEVEKIEFLSDAYFDLLDEDERVAEFYALGDAVIFVLDEVAYEIVPEAAE